MDTHLPAEPFASDVRAIVAKGGTRLDDLAVSIGVHPQWLRKIMRGEITELPLLTVAVICRRLRLMPEDIWEPGLVARAFRDFPPSAFDPD